MPWDFLLLLVLLGVVLPWRSATEIRRLLRMPKLSTAGRLVVYASTIALQWIAVGVVYWRTNARGITPEQLGLAAADAPRVILAAVALTIALGLYQLLSLARLAKLPPERQGFEGELARKILPQNTAEMLTFLALTATVALCEEFLFRGFAFAALREASGGSLGAAIAGSSLLFAAAHAYQGARGMALTFGVGAIFAFVRDWTGSLIPTMVAHFFADLLAGVLAPCWLATPRQCSPLEATKQSTLNSAPTIPRPEHNEK